MHEFARNPFRELLRERRVIYGALVGMPTSRLIELCAYVGFDWVMVDGEHDLLDLRACYDLAIAADAAHVPLLARTPANRPELIQAFAEAGAHAVLVPHIRSAADVQTVISSLRFPPLGSRGVSSLSRAARYGTWGGYDQYFATVDGQPMAGIMVEELEAIKCLDDIVGVDGLDFCMVGAGDLAGALGQAGKPGNPEVQRLVTETTQRIATSGCLVGRVANSPEEADDCVANGARLIVTPITPLITRAMVGYLSSVSRE